MSLAVERTKEKASVLGANEIGEYLDMWSGHMVGQSYRVGFYPDCTGNFLTRRVIWSGVCVCVHV